MKHVTLNKRKKGAKHLSIHRLRLSSAVRWHGKKLAWRTACQCMPLHHKPAWLNLKFICHGSWHSSEKLA